MTAPEPSDFGGFEPVVGTVHAVRSFRIGPGGELHPLYHDTPWDDPVVTAHCLLHEGADHVAPDAECVCGLYAYSGVHAAREDPHSGRVLGVVACWGRIVTGTRGLRAEHARVEALWISRRVPEPVVEQVRTRHPWVTVHRDRAAMLRAHPPTRLPGYEPERDRTRRHLLVLSGAAAATAAMLPQNWQAQRTTWWFAELALLAAAAAVMALLVYRSRDAGRVGAGGSILLVLATAIWLAAPFGGTAGDVLVRGGVCCVAALGAVHRAGTRRRAARIPVHLPTRASAGSSASAG